MHAIDPVFSLVLLVVGTTFLFLFVGLLLRSYDLLQRWISCRRTYKYQKGALGPLFFVLLPFIAVSG